MANLIVFLVGIVALTLLWEYGFRGTILDHCRDELFALRDEVRVWFIENGYGTDRPEYGELRNLLNTYLRLTRIFRLSAYLYVFYKYLKTPNVFDAAVKRLDDRFRTEDPAIRAYIHEVRGKSAGIMLWYARWGSFSAIIIVNSFLAIGSLSRAVHGLYARLTDTQAVERFLTLGENYGRLAMAA